MTTFIIMASSISCSTCFSLSSSSSTRTKQTPYCNSSLSVTSQSKSSTFHLTTLFSSLGFSVFSSWNGLKHLGISIGPKLKLERKRRCRNRAVYASLFGVGAPEALVIGVVALLVFGPKGLAEVARNLGKTLRAFQPTIREIQEVSREFKSTLEREIGLDDIPGSTQSSDPYVRNTSSRPSSTLDTEDSNVVADPNDASSPNSAYTTEEYLKITKEQLKAASTAQQQQQEPTSLPSENQSEALDCSQASIKETAAGTALTQLPESENVEKG